MPEEGRGLQARAVHGGGSIYSVSGDLRKAGGCYLRALCLHLCGKAGVCESVLD